VTHDDFRGWKKRHRLTNHSTAAVLGKSARYYSDLSSGISVVPAYIEGACWAYDRGWRPEEMGGPVDKEDAGAKLASLQTAIAALLPTHNRR
jgi:hypothetical protein